jgi:hypothetical protein
MVYYIITNMYCLCVSGWHYRVNHKADGGGLGFYLLVPLLQREAKLVQHCVDAEDLQRDSRKTGVEKKLKTAWEKLQGDEVTTTHFLRTVGDIYKPTDHGHDASVVVSDMEDDDEEDIVMDHREGE